MAEPIWVAVLGRDGRMGSEAVRAVDAARARPDVPRSPSFDAFVAQSQPAPLDHRTLRSLADELERIVLTPGATDAAPSPSNNSQETR